MSTTNIQWAQEVWNPTTGCDRISPGCDSCYAMAMAKRLKAMGAAKYQRDGHPHTSGPGFGVAVHPEVLELPLSWRVPRRVFVDSMSDVGHPRIPRSFVAQMWAVMALSLRHEYLVLSKRPKRLATMLRDPNFASLVAQETTKLVEAQPDTLQSGDSCLGGDWTGRPLGGRTLRSQLWPLPNTWIGTSIESDEYSWRADELRKAPAAIRFLSLEPLLGPLPHLDLTGIDWVIVGGESGPRHRPLDLRWVRDIRDCCVDQGVPFFFKQVGGRTPKTGGRILDGRTWDEYPIGHRIDASAVPL